MNTPKITRINWRSAPLQPVVKNPDIKEKYLDYMNFGTKEDMFELSINKYCIEGSEQYEYFKAESAVLKAKPIYPKFKLDHFMSSMNYH